VQISVAICTRNRARQLSEMLETAAAMRVPPGLAWEVLIVDNGSTDNTPQVVEGFAARLPIRRVFEGTPGLSNARNKGVAEARGAYICWTDDDVLLDPDWLAAYAEAFAEHPEAAVFGGRVMPVLQPPTPGWFMEVQRDGTLDNLLAKRDFGAQGRVLSLTDGRSLPYGANYAIRTADQRKCLYDPRFGVSPDHKRLGEETRVFAALGEAGEIGWWVPGAKVNHIIPATRQTIRYALQYFMSAGETWALERQIEPHRLSHSSLPANISPMLMQWMAVKHLLRFAWFWALRRPGVWVHDLHIAGFYRGALSYRRHAQMKG